MRVLVGLTPLLASVLLGGCDDGSVPGKGFCATALSGSKAALVCDDFESATVDAKYWTTQLEAGGEAVIERTEDGVDLRSGPDRFAYRGQSALKLSAPPGGIARLVETKQTSALNAPGAGYAVRMFMFIEASKSNEIVRLEDAAGLPRLSFSLDGGNPRLDVGDSKKTSSTHLSTNAWSCVELRVGTDGNGVSRASVLVAEKEVLSMPYDSSTNGALTSRIGLAPAPVAEATSTTTWLDEVIIDGFHNKDPDRQIIGCKR